MSAPAGFEAYNTNRGNLCATLPNVIDFNQFHQVTQAPPDHRQHLQRDIRILAAELLKVVLVDKERPPSTRV